MQLGHKGAGTQWAGTQCGWDIMRLGNNRLGHNRAGTQWDWDNAFSVTICTCSNQMSKSAGGCHEAEAEVVLKLKKIDQGAYSVVSKM